MTKHLNTDTKVLLKLGIPLLIIGIVLAAIGETYWPPLFLIGFAVIFLGLLICWLSTTFPF